MTTNKLNLDKLKLLQTRANCEVAGACVREPFNLPAGCPPVPKPVITVVDTCKLPDLVATKNIISSAVLLTPDIGFSVDTYCVDVKTKITGPGAGSLSWRVSPEAGDCTVGQYELDLSLECPISDSEVTTGGRLVGGIYVSNCTIEGDLCVPLIDINAECDCKKVIKIEKIHKPPSSSPGDGTGCGTEEFEFDIKVTLPCPNISITKSGKSFITLNSPSNSSGGSYCEGDCEYEWEIEVDCPGESPGLNLGGNIKGDFTRTEDCSLNLSLCVPEYTFKTEVNYVCPIKDEESEDSEGSGDSENPDYSYYPEDSNDSEEPNYSTTQQPRFTVETTELSPRDGSSCGDKEITIALDIPKPPELELEATVDSECEGASADVTTTESSESCIKTSTLTLTLPPPPAFSFSGSGGISVTSSGSPCDGYNVSISLDTEPCVPEISINKEGTCECACGSGTQTVLVIDSCCGDDSAESDSESGSSCRQEIPVGECVCNPESEPPETTISGGKGISVTKGGSLCDGYTYTISLDDNGGNEPCVPEISTENKTCSCGEGKDDGTKTVLIIDGCCGDGSTESGLESGSASDSESGSGSNCRQEIDIGECQCEEDEPSVPEINVGTEPCTCEGGGSGERAYIEIDKCQGDGSAESGSDSASGSDCKQKIYLNDCPCEEDEPCIPEISTGTTTCDCGGGKTASQAVIIIDNCCGEDSSGSESDSESGSNTESDSASASSTESGSSSNCRQEIPVGECPCEEDEPCSPTFETTNEPCTCEGDTGDTQSGNQVFLIIKKCCDDGSTDTDSGSGSNSDCEEKIPVGECQCAPTVPRYRRVLEDCPCPCDDPNMSPTGVKYLLQIAPNGCPDDVSDDCGWQTIMEGPCEGCTEAQTEYQFTTTGCDCGEGEEKGTQTLLQSRTCGSDWVTIAEGECECKDKVCAIDSIDVTDNGCDPNSTDKTVAISWYSTYCPELAGVGYFTVPCPGGGGGGEDPGGGEGGPTCEEIRACVEDEGFTETICDQVSKCKVISDIWDSMSQISAFVETRLDDFGTRLDEFGTYLDEMNESIASEFRGINAQLDEFNQSIGDLYRRMETCCPAENNN